MTPAMPRRAPMLEAAAARLYHRIGLPGAFGLALLLTAAVSVALAWRPHQRFGLEAQMPESRGIAEPMTARTDAATSQPRVQASLPSASDIPLLLTRIQRAALDSGLGWPRADYRFNAANDDTPASLEVQCTLKGPYLAIRRFVTTLLQDTPTLTLREFDLSRPNADAADVEAKFSIVVYLATDAAAPGLVGRR